MNKIIFPFALLACLLPLRGAHALPDLADPFACGLEQTLTVSLPQLSAPQTRSFARQPLCFERNEGQTDSSVAFVSRGCGYTLFLARDEVVLKLVEPPKRNDGFPVDPQALRSGNADFPVVETGRLENRRYDIGADDPLAAECRTDSPASVVRMRLSGANPQPTIEGDDHLRAMANYFIGNEPALWRTNIPTFGKVHYRGVYPGIDLVFYGNEGQLEYDFVVAPGADPNRIAMVFEGADEVRVDSSGDLILKVGEREVRWQKPLIYQEFNGGRHEIAGTYTLGTRAPQSAEQAEKLHDVKFVSFTLAGYDPALPLVIDPRLVYSTYLGGSGDENQGQTVAVDKQGNVYVAGVTASLNFPTKAALQGSAPGGETDAFVAKFNGTGQLLFSTYLGGTARDYIGWASLGYSSGGGIAFTSAGDCYLVGSTQSRDFPLVNPLQDAHGGGYDVFVATLKSDGSALLFSTYLGGRANDRPLALRVGPGDDLFLSGLTDSTNFPTTNAFQPELSSPFENWQQPDGFLVRFEAGGKSIRYSTYYGWYGTLDRASGLVVDAEGNAYVALLSDWHMEGQWVLAKISENGSTWLFEQRWPALVASYPIQQFLMLPQLALAPNGRLVLAAPVELDGELLPAINEPDPSIYNWSKVYIALFDITNGNYISAVYLGGIGNNGVGGLCVDAAGDIIVAGDASAQVTENGTEPSGFPVTDPLEQGPEPGSIEGVFVTKYRSSDLSMVFSTLLGGGSCSGLALDPDGGVWVAGTTGGPFPTVNAFQSQFGGGGSDAFLAKLSFGERLQVSLSGQTLKISWPLAATNFVVQSATTLASGGDWQDSSLMSAVVGNQNVVSVDATNTAGFFRLRGP